MKTFVSKFLGVLLVVLLILAIIYNTNNLFENKQGGAKCEAFFISPHDYDIFYFGTSHAVMGFLPMELWDEYHMTSFNFANYGQWIPVNYWLLQLAMQYQKPKLVVIDTYGYTSDDKASEGHNEIFDTFPYSTIKKEAVEDLFPTTHRLDYIFPFSIYHSKWNSIDKNCFMKGTDLYFYGKGSDENGLNGTDYPIWVEPQNDIGPINDTDVVNVESVGKDYLIKMIELCQENDIDVLLTTIPYCVNDITIGYNNGVYEIADNNGVQFYNGLVQDIVDVNTDFWDEGHLNSSGARKWTHSLGEYISNTYNIPAYSSGNIYNKWKTEYENAYMENKLSIILKSTTLENYLMLCSDKNLSACIYINNVVNYENKNELISLMENLVGQKTLEGLKQAISNKDNYLLIVSKVDEEIIEVDTNCVYKEAFSFGEVYYGDHILTINQSENYLVEQNIDEVIPYMQIVLINNKTHQIVDVARFEINGENKAIKIQ